ncbi:MAG: hypothetical protein ACM3SM_02495 [Bacteroidota bacterium]
MLEKIDIIKPDINYHGSGHNAYTAPYKHMLHKEGNLHDSIRFSPAARLLTKIGWQLKEVTFSSNEKLLLVFVAEQFEFETEVDFLRITRDLRQYYRINMRNTGTYSLVSVNLSVAKGRYNQDEDIRPVKLKGIRKLFDRILALGLSGSIDKYEISALATLIEGLEEAMTDEFIFINSALYNLINKLSNNKLPSGLVFKEDNKDYIIIDKVAAINDRKFP